MAKAKIYNQDGVSVGELELKDEVFNIAPHKQSMFDMVLLQRASLRQGTHKVKTRSEVRGGGRKPWRQKGTGRARQGSIRSPQWRGGGVVFGPTPRDYGFKLNRKVRRLALKSALSTKYIDNNLVVVDKLHLDVIKTKEMLKVLDNLKIETKVLVVIDDVNLNVELSARNIPGVLVIYSNGVNVLDLLNYDKVIMTVDAVKTIEEVLL